MKIEDVTRAGDLKNRIKSLKYALGYRGYPFPHAYTGHLLFQIKVVGEDDKSIYEMHPEDGASQTLCDIIKAMMTEELARLESELEAL